MKTHYLIIGSGVSGRGVAAYLKSKELCFEIGDDAQGPPLDFVSDEGSAFWSKITCAIVSPGIGEKSVWLKAARQAGIEIQSEANFILPKIQAPLYAITGTNGKTTTTLFITWALSQKGFLARACGNVGYSLGEFACELADKKNKEIPMGIVELSSYQLEGLRGSFFDGGIFLNLTPDHLERHKTLEAYARAKANLSFCMKPKKVMRVQKKAFETYKHLFSECAKPFSTESLEEFQSSENLADTQGLLREKAIGLPKHSLENALASAYILKDFGISLEETLTLYKAFPQPDHRQELAFEIGGVRFINDSKSTNLAAIEAAFEAEAERSIWLIAGGFDKGEDFKSLNIDTKRLLGVIAMGQSAPNVLAAFEGVCSTYFAKDLEDAVQYAREKARSNESVLFSPGCSSFDMFENYIDRGEQFKYTVERSSLQGEYS